MCTGVLSKRRTVTRREVNLSSYVLSYLARSQFHCTQLCNFLWFRLNTLFQSTIPRLLKEVAGVCFVIDKWWGLEKGAAAAFPGGGCFSSSFNLPPQDAVYFYAHKSLPHTLSTRMLPLVFFLYFFPPPLHVI